MGTENDAVSRRIEQAIGDESVRSFAERADLNEATLRRYMAGQEPKLTALRRIATAAGVTVEWLATGAGPQSYDGPTPSAIAEPRHQYGPGNQEFIAELSDSISCAMYECGIVDRAKRQYILDRAYRALTAAFRDDAQALRSITPDRIAVLVQLLEDRFDERRGSTRDE